jgi:class 3 adenylate cyclase/tetratricopeptide (TPR) repeat protein
LSSTHAVEDVRATLNNPAHGYSALRRIWDQRDRGLWEQAPNLYTLLAHRARRMGAPFWAYDIAAEGLQYADQPFRLLQIQAMCLSQSGSPAAAQSILNKLVASGHSDSETLSLLARTHKDFAQYAETTEENRAQLEKAHGYYSQAFQSSQDYYPGINAATTALLLEQPELARDLALKVREACRPDEDQESYWQEATLAEAALLLGNFTEAHERYAHARELAENDPSVVSSMHKQARLLLGALNEDPDMFSDCFRIGSVVPFSGHMIDAGNTRHPRFPREHADQVGKMISDAIRKLDARFGYASAACGSDILFLEAMLGMGAEIHVVLPFEQASFRETSVDILPGSDWGARFDQVLANAASVTYLNSTPYSGDPIEFQYANDVILGLACLKRNVLDTALRPLAVWDGGGNKTGGTGSTVRDWEARGHTVEIVDLNAVIPEADQRSYIAQTQKIPVADPQPHRLRREIKAILFTDVVGFSRLTENDVEVYIRYFFGGIAERLEQAAHKPIIRNTWGDALFLVFDSVRDAGSFALEVRQLVNQTEWQKLGLSQSLQTRIGLHAGPVSLHEDPVTNRLSCIGSHVNRAARIEPITEEGQIYASETFAAIAAMEDHLPFACDYVGERQLAKKFGLTRLYLVRSLTRETTSP